MNRVPALLLALLCVLSAPVLALPAGTISGASSAPDAQSATASPLVTDTPEVPANTTAKLVLDQILVSGRSTTTVDVSGSLSIGTSELDERYAEAKLDERIEAAESSAERSEILDEELDRVDDRIQTLQEREQRIYGEYVDGDVTDREFLRELARVHVEATQLRSTLQQIDQYARQGSHLSSNQRAQGLIVETSAFGGPVRERIADSMRGDAEPIQVTIQVDRTGVVLSMIEGETFVREAYRADQHNRTAASGQRIDNFENRVGELYPWAWSNQDSFDWRGVIDTGLYRVIISHPQGQVTSYIDTNTENPYREIQRLQLDRIPVEEEAVVTEDDLRVQVNRTYPGGPVQVTLLDEETGLPRSGFIELDDGHVIPVHSDGVGWFVSEPGEHSFTVTSETTTVSITVS